MNADGATEIGVEEGRLVFATAEGMKTVDANQKIVLAVSGAGPGRQRQQRQGRRPFWSTTGGKVAIGAGVLAAGGVVLALADDDDDDNDNQGDPAGPGRARGPGPGQKAREEGFLQTRAGQPERLIDSPQLSRRITGPQPVILLSLPHTFSLR